MRKIRCAIYTRKSSEEGLDQEFNSLHAQREACAAYVMSQKHEGWGLLPQHYDDGGISGGTLERPGLERLMADVDEGLVDQIVVYKIDRLTRSLADFAKLVERLDAAQASFVSVTQSFNTATSMGRLTLNVLLSFAQFEREVTAERIRDKIAASKKKGLWMGGNAPLGYEPDGRTLKIREEDAAIVRSLYAIYLRCGSLIETTAEAERLGLRTQPRWTRSSAKGEGTSPTSSLPMRLFGRSQIHYILANPVYVGLIRHRNQIHEGQHQPIIERAMWEEVQARLAAGARRGRGDGTAACSSSSRSSPLVGKLFDETGDCLTPSHANKKGKRYRYYVSTRMITGKAEDQKLTAAKGWRLPARPLEDQLARSVLGHLRTRLQHSLLIEASIDETARILRLFDKAESRRSTDHDEAALSCIARASIAPGSIAITLDIDSLAQFLAVDAVAIDPAALSFEIPFQFRKRGVESKLIIGEAQATSADLTLIRNIARARRYFDALMRGASFDEIAAQEQVSKHRILQTIDLAFLAPDIVRSVVEGRQPASLSTKWLTRNPLPSDWNEQRRIIASL